MSPANCFNRNTFMAPAARWRLAPRRTGHCSDNLKYPFGKIANQPKATSVSTPGAMGCALAKTSMREAFAVPRMAFARLVSATFP